MNVTTKEDARMVPTFASTVVKKATLPENTLASVEKVVDSY